MMKNDSLKNNQAKLISLGKIPELLKEGWHQADLHVHTYYSHDVLPSKFLDPIVLYEKARKRGMKYITFTDHDNMDAYDRVGWTREGLVPGVEIKIKDVKNVGHSIHVNVYELNKLQFKELMEIAKIKQDIRNIHNLPERKQFTVCLQSSFLVRIWGKTQF